MGKLFSFSFWYPLISPPPSSDVGTACKYMHTLFCVRDFTWHTRFGTAFCKIVLRNCQKEEKSGIVRERAL